MSVVDIARTYVGTPFHHQGRLPGVGLDCAGTIVCALTACGIEIQDVKGYSRVPSGTLLTEAVEQHCDKVALHEMLPGDVLLFRIRTDPQHLALVSAIAPVTIIHGYSEAGFVVETGLDNFWLPRLEACYRIRGL